MAASPTSSAQVNRIVSLVAELSRAKREDGVPLQEVATRFETTISQIRADIRALTQLGEQASDWLLSLSASQVGDRVTITSQGPFRRPLRLTREELIAMQVALAEEGEAGQQLARRLAELGRLADAETAAATGVAVSTPRGGDHVDVVRTAIRERRRLQILYVKEGEPGGTERVVHPFELRSQDGATYLHAWCERNRGWRHFRLDRILDALLAAGTFEPREDFTPLTDERGVFREPEGGVDRVSVRFAPSIARWIVEHHPECRPTDDGGAIVVFPVASPAWFTRMILQYGTEAEVLEPPEYRAAMGKRLGQRAQA